MTRGADLPNPTSVASVRKAEANRRNARASTGPRTVAGKARAAQNARRHGLNLPARYDPSGRVRSARWRARSPARFRGGTPRARVPDRRRADRCRAGAARAPGPLSAGAARARCDRPACGDRPLRGARAVSAQARDARLRRRARSSLRRHAGRYFGGTKPPGEGAQDGGQRRPRRCRRVLQALRKVDLPVGRPGGCTDPVDDSGIAPLHATSSWALRQNEANRKGRARHRMPGEDCRPPVG